MIICSVCQSEFKSLITQTHLKTHGMTVQDYRNKFGNESHLSPEYLAKLRARPIRRGWKHSEESKSQMSDKLKDRVVGPRGPMSDEQRRLLSEKAKRRPLHGSYWLPNDPLGRTVGVD